jgi:hypothetical protein
LPKHTTSIEETTTHRVTINGKDIMDYLRGLGYDPKTDRINFYDVDHIDDTLDDGFLEVTWTETTAKS